MDFIAGIGSTILFVVLFLLALALVAGAIFFAWWAIASFIAWWKANPPKDPVYDASVRYRPSKLPRIALWGVVALFVALNVAQVSGVMI